MTERSFIVKGDDGEEYGPVPLYELRLWVRENRAGLGTLVRLEGEDSPWQAWQDFPELVVLLAESRSSAVVPGRPDLVLAPFVTRLAAMILDCGLTCFLCFPMTLIYFLVLPPIGQESFVDFVVNPPQLDFSDPTKNAQLIPPEWTDLVLLGFGVWAIYLGAFTCAHGRTPGKSIFGLEVVNDAGNPPSMLQATLRTSCFIFSILFFKVGVLLFLIPYFFGMQRRALHDLVAGTMVVKASKSS
jgi:uncharacterized RDD family membrane protein YckC